MEAQKSYIFNLNTLGLSRLQDVIDDVIDDLFTYDIGDSVEIICDDRKEFVRKIEMNRYRLFQLLARCYVKAKQGDIPDEAEIIVYSNGGSKDENS